MNTITHTVDQAVVSMVEKTQMFFSANVQNLVCYNFKNFKGSVSIRVEGRSITQITAKVEDPSSTKGEYDWCSAEFSNPRIRPFITDRDWMRDMFLAINEVARGNIEPWENMGIGFRKVALDQVPLKFC
ncbi:MAG: hypothetical protein ACRC7W_00555 [Fusobacteriaceae bacterium]